MELSSTSIFLYPEWNPYLSIWTVMAPVAAIIPCLKFTEVLSCSCATMLMGQTNQSISIPLMYRLRLGWLSIIWATVSTLRLWFRLIVQTSYTTLINYFASTSEGHRKLFPLSVSRIFSKLDMRETGVLNFILFKSKQHDVATLTSL